MKNDDCFVVTFLPVRYNLEFYLFLAIYFSRNLLYLKTYRKLCSSYSSQHSCTWSHLAFGMKRVRQTDKVEIPVLQNLRRTKKQKTGFCSPSHPYALVDWGTLPHHVILHIFQFLPLVDRARASSVCRRWNEVFHIPDLWRRFEFELSQPATSYLKSTHPDLIQQIIKKHADHLQYVSFKVKIPLIKEMKVFIYTVVLIIIVN